MAHKYSKKAGGRDRTFQGEEERRENTKKKILKEGLAISSSRKIMC